MGNSRGNTQGPIIGAHFHGDELVLLRKYLNSGMLVLSSKSKDGEMMSKILNWFGFKVIRGSSSKGGAEAFRQMVSTLKFEKLDASLAVDGPHGPIYQVKKGVVKLAQQTGYPIIPGSAAASSSFIFKKAWNQCYLPWPFSKAVIVYGEPIWVPENLSDLEFENFRLKVQNELLRLKNEANAYFMRSPEFSTRLNGA